MAGAPGESPDMVPIKEERIPFHPIYGRDATQEERERIAALKVNYERLRSLIGAIAPANRERALALTYLEDSAMRATRAILQGGP